MNPSIRNAALVLFALLAFPTFAQESPDQTVRRVSEETVQAIKADPKIIAGDPVRIREVIEQKLLPNFDFTRMTALAMGRNWRQTTPEQQKRLADEFRTLLVRTYSNALTQYRDEKIEVRPLRADANATDVTVRSEVVRPGRPPVQIDYAMTRTPEGWKAYDVVVGGVSLVSNYRDEFNEQVKAGGVEGLIKTLADKNRAAPAK